MSKINDCLEKQISKECIEYYEYSDFKNIQPIGKGSFGSVYRATWKNTSRYFALKSFNNDKQTHKEILKEV
jgi:serine/threonine protein kinase